MLMVKTIEQNYDGGVLNLHLNLQRKLTLKIRCAVPITKAAIQSSKQGDEGKGTMHKQSRMRKG
jgi:hypothetical protein